jgi:hypothetical protein
MDEIIINLFKFNSVVLSILILSVTVFGVIVGSIGIYEGWLHSSGDDRFSTRRATVTGALLKMMIGGAAAVGAAVFYQLAGTFSVADDPTVKQVLNFGLGQSLSGTYCQRFQYSITIVFMILGTVAFFNGFRLAYQKSNGSQITWGQPINFFVGGVFCYFVNQITNMAAATLNMDIGLDKLCSALTS